jgi:hypothetical protein
MNWTDCARRENEEAGWTSWDGSSDQLVCACAHVFKCIHVKMGVGWGSSKVSGSPDGIKTQNWGFMQ